MKCRNGTGKSWKGRSEVVLKGSPNEKDAYGCACGGLFYGWLFATDLYAIWNNRGETLKRMVILVLNQGVL